MTSPTDPLAVPGASNDKRRSIGLAHVVFFVVGAAAPLTAMVGTTPPAFAFGRGPVVAAAFVMVGILYLLFSVGFTAMSRHVGGAGGFYLYLTQGFGPCIGMGGAAVMVVTYSAIQIAVYALFGIFLADASQSWGVAIPWWAWSFVAIALVTICGRRSVSFSGNLLAVFMTAEMLILLVLDCAILAHGGGPNGFSLQAFNPAVFMVPGLGVAMIFVIASFVGFEATTIFSEEVARPAVTIPRATYVAVLLITVFYALSTWCITLYYGLAGIADAAQADMQNLYFKPTEQLLGPTAVDAMRFLLEVSLFACVLSLHSTISRYLFALGRDQALPRALASRHARHGSPHIASGVQSLSAMVVLTVFILAGADPYAVIFSWTSALGVVGILLVQIVVCAAIIAFFRKRPQLSSGRWAAIIAPGMSLIGLAAVLALLVSHLPLLAGSQSHGVYFLAPGMLVVGAAGVTLALWLRRQRPDIYANLGRSLIE